MPSKLISVAAGLAAMLLIAALPKSSVAQLMQYDDFNSRHIDPAKWNGSQNYDPDLREAVRQIVRGKKHGSLRLSQTAYSSKMDDMCGSWRCVWSPVPRARRDHGGFIPVTVERAEAVGCSSNEDPTTSSLRHVAATQDNRNPAAGWKPTGFQSPRLSRYPTVRA